MSSSRMSGNEWNRAAYVRLTSSGPVRGAQNSGERRTASTAYSAAIAAASWRLNAANMASTVARGDGGGTGVAVTAARAATAPVSDVTSSSTFMIRRRAAEHADQRAVSRPACHRDHRDSE